MLCGCELPALWLKTSHLSSELMFRVRRTGLDVDTATFRNQLNHKIIMLITSALCFLTVWRITRGAKRCNFSFQCQTAKEIQLTCCVILPLTHAWVCTRTILDSRFHSLASPVSPPSPHPLISLVCFYILLFCNHLADTSNPTYLWVCPVLV